MRFERTTRLSATDPRRSIGASRRFARTREETERVFGRSDAFVPTTTRRAIGKPRKTFARARPSTTASGSRGVAGPGFGSRRRRRRCLARRRRLRSRALSTTAASPPFARGSDDDHSGGQARARREDLAVIHGCCFFKMSAFRWCRLRERSRRERSRWRTVVAADVRVVFFAANSAFFFRARMDAFESNPGARYEIVDWSGAPRCRSFMSARMRNYPADKYRG